MTKRLNWRFALIFVLTVTLASQAAYGIVVHIANIDVTNDFKSSTIIGGYNHPAQCAYLEIVKVKANPFSGPSYNYSTSWNVFYLDNEGGNCPGWASIGWGDFRDATSGYHSVRGVVKFFYYSGPDIVEVEFDDATIP